MAQGIPVKEDTATKHVTYHVSGTHKPTQWQPNPYYMLDQVFERLCDAQDELHSNYQSGYIKRKQSEIIETYVDCDA